MSARNVFQDRAAIVGIGQTRFGKGFTESEEELGGQAIMAALNDAGIDPAEVDGLCSYTMQTTGEDDIARDLGFGDIRFFSRLPAGGGGGCGTVGHAAMAIASGQADVVVAWRSRKRSGRASRVWSQTNDRIAGSYQWSQPYGLARPSDELGIMTRRMMHDYGFTREHLANIALAFRAHANRNPNAVMHAKTLTREQYMAARFISEPLCLFDCCIETDGALAAVLVSAERARDLRQPPAYVHAFAQGISRGSYMMLNVFNPDTTHTQGYACAQALWGASEFKPKDVNVAQIYDAFSPQILQVLADYGFCERGEAGAFTDNGNIMLGGKLPLNTSGGSLSEVYTHGFNLILEAVRQIRGTSTAQVPNVQCSFVSSANVVPTNALLLRK